jgi:DNA-binding transcriptional LysR family regulator
VNTSSLVTVLAPTLVAAVNAEAPRIDLIFQPWASRNDAVTALVKGTADIALAAFPDAGRSDLHVENVLDQDYLVAMRDGHPASRKFDLDGWLARPHILVSSGGRTTGALDKALARIGRERRIGVVVPSFLVVPDLLRASDMIALLPSLCTHARWSQGITIRPPAIAVDGFTLSLAWHRHRVNRRLILFVADQMKVALASLAQVPFRREPQPFESAV